MLLLAVVITGSVLRSYGGDDGGQSETRGPGYDEAGLLLIDDTFYGLAAATGGDFYFWAPGEFSSASLQVPSDDEDILLAYGRFETPQQVFEFPIDPEVSRFSVVAGAQEKLTFTLLGPDGVVVNAAQPGVELQRFKHMLVVTLVEPEPGRWTFEAQGRGRYAVSVRASLRSGMVGERVMLLDWSPVELRGRPGHQGYFDSTAPLVAGRRRRCRASVAGRWQSVQLELCSLDGRHLESVRMLDTGSEDWGEILGDVVIPAEIFRVRLAGTSRSGAAFLRTLAPSFTPVEPVRQ